MGAVLTLPVLMGSMLMLVGGCMALWPSEMTSLSQDDDGRPIPTTPANVRWMRIFGIALVVLGACLLWAGLVGVKGADDPVLF